MPSSLIVNENNVAFNNQFFTFSVSNNDLYGRHEEEHRRQYYASRLCEHRTKSAPANPIILDSNIIKSDNIKTGLLVSIPDLLSGEKINEKRSLLEATTSGSNRYDQYSTVAIDANVIDSNKLGFAICLPVNSEKSKRSKETLV